MKFMNILMECSKMRSEPSEYMWKTRVILIHLENYFGKYAQEVWERNWMNRNMHTMLLVTKLQNATLFNMYNTTSMENIQNVFMRLFHCKKQSTYTNVLHRLNLRV